MLSNYFLKKTAMKKFIDDLNWSIGEMKDKKVIIYGAGEGFEYLFDKFPFKDMNIVAIADMKFKEEGDFKGLRAIPPTEIVNQDYDVILVTNEFTNPIINYLNNDLNILDKEIRTIFNETISEERNNFLYLENYNFKKHLEKLNKKLKGKKVVIYGAGIFFEAIHEFYDLSKLDIIGISDRRFSDGEEDEFLGYKAVAPEKIKDLNPDYVLVATKFFINIMEDLDENVLYGSKIKIRPLVRKPFLVLWKEIWR